MKKPAPPWRVFCFPGGGAALPCMGHRASLPHMLRLLLLGLSFCLALMPPGRAAAQVRIAPEAVIALAEAPWRDRHAFVDALGEVLGGLDLEMPRLSEALRREDPFLWSVMGRFGAPLAGQFCPLV